MTQLLLLTRALEEEEHKELPSAMHTRRASTTFAGRFSQQVPNLPEPHVERGTGVLRRLSLSSGGLMKVFPVSIRVATTSQPTPQPADSSSFSPQSPPAVPPNSAVSPRVMPLGRDAKPRRSATVSEKPRRAPSPMGERMLKGHFDGFN